MKKVLSKIVILIVIAVALLFLSACDNGVISSEIKSEAVQVNMTTEDVAINCAYHDDINTDYVLSTGTIDDLIARAKELGEEITISVSADWSYYFDVNELVYWSTDIIRAEILSERVGYVNTSANPEQRRYTINTVHELRVIDVIKGDREAGDIVEVMQGGGQVGYVTINHRDRVQLNIGDDLVFFLRDPNIEGMPTVLLNPNQSIYRFPSADNEIARAMGLDYELESIMPNDNWLPRSWELTLEDLAEVTEANIMRQQEAQR